MRSVWAIARVTLRGAIRSRMVLLLLLLLLGAVTGLPLAVRGDGTMAGLVQVRAGFTLGAAAALLGLTAIWTGCTAVSAEAADRRIHLLVTKPVFGLQIWLGKWLGLFLLQAGLLAVVGLSLVALLRWTTRPSRLTAGQREELRGEVWVCRAAAPLAAPGLEDERRRAVREWEAEHGGGRAAPPAVREAIRRQVAARSMIVPPGEARAWTVRLPVEPEPDATLRLRFRLLKSRLDLEPVDGLWVFGRPGEAPARILGAWRPHVVTAIELPGGGPGRDRELAFVHRGGDGEASVMFDPDEGLTLWVEQGTFEANLARALLMILFRLAFLTAAGLAAGTLFSFPVAALCTCTLALTLTLGGSLAEMAGQRHYLGRGEGDSPAVSLLDRGLRAVYSGLDLALRPLGGYDAAQAAAGGRRVSWARAGQSLAVHLGFYGGSLALLSAAAFRRRQWGAAA